ncbi:MAG: hypothetical protein WDN03_02195 [Rhizomicrobium sp.]
MLLANFQTKVFHNNADPETNRWAADTIGRVLQRRGTYSEGQSLRSSPWGCSRAENTSWGSNSSYGGSSDGHGHYSSNSQRRKQSRRWGRIGGRNRGRNTGESTSGGYTETMDYEIEPGAFAQVLRTGGPANKNCVTAVWFQAGKVFADSRRNYLVTTFPPMNRPAIFNYIIGKPHQPHRAMGPDGVLRLSVVRRWRVGLVADHYGVRSDFPRQTRISASTSTAIGNGTGTR